MIAQKVHYQSASPRVQALRPYSSGFCPQCRGQLRSPKRYIIKAQVPNTAFSIVGNQLQINNSPDFETQNSYNIRVKTTDQGGLGFEKVLVITVNDLNETPGN